MFFDNSTSHRTTASMQTRLASTGLGFVRADVVGGWKGDQYASNPVLGLQEGGIRIVLKNRSAEVSQCACVLRLSRLPL